MSESLKQDWNPEAYARFRGLRLRPALDLMAQIPALPAGDVVDLGCGNGPVGAALRQRFGRPLLGVDASPAMLAEAAKTGDYTGLTEGDITAWQPKTPPALIFSNAALQWLGHHPQLLPRLAGLLAPAGVLAVQMPRQYFAPSHRFLRDIAQSMFPDRFDYLGWEAPVKPASAYWELLAPLGHVEVWETEYVQHLGATPSAHPVRCFTESTAMRPIVDRLNATEQGEFLARYEDALHAAYPLREDGSVLMPFRRVFMVLSR